MEHLHHHQHLEEDLNPSTHHPCLHFISAFLSMEPTDCLISFARECGGGSITEKVQNFILEHCINQSIRKNSAPSALYVKTFMKKVIIEVESSGDEVLDGLYEQYAYYITSLKDDSMVKDTARVCKTITFIFPNGCSEISSCPKSMKIEVPLRCSLNMFEGDTGCSIWPSSLFLAEFILSYPELFSAKSCFEVGSGVGLVGISLAFVKASKVECKYLSWESASEVELQGFRPDIVLGADVIYDPLCLPHLVRVLAALLNPQKPNLCRRQDAHGAQNGFCDNNNADDKLNLNLNRRNASSNFSSSDGEYDGNGSLTCEDNPKSLGGKRITGPLAYLAAVIRNEETFNYFLELANQAHLSVVDITKRQKPLSLLPYMRSYDRSSIRLFTVSFL